MLLHSDRSSWFLTFLVADLNAVLDVGLLYSFSFVSLKTSEQINTKKNIMKDYYFSGNCNNQILFITPIGTPRCDIYTRQMGWKESGIDSLYSCFVIFLLHW
ncbi:hypothetical protein Dimus_006071 [Dionaea muscipula]